MCKNSGNPDLVCKNYFYPRNLYLYFFLIAAVINQDWFVGRLFGNTLWLIAIGYYIYITFLGYSGKYHIIIIKDDVEGRDGCCGSVD